MSCKAVCPQMWGMHTLKMLQSSSQKTRDVYIEFWISFPKPQKCSMKSCMCCLASVCQMVLVSHHLSYIMAGLDENDEILVVSPITLRNKVRVNLP